MPGTLVFLEHHGDELLKPSLAVLSKAAQLGGDVSAVLVGSGVEPLAAGAGAFAKRCGGAYSAVAVAVAAGRSTSST